jgi:TRAP-type mannitol/chloroaromatic compound transport system permease large subunit
MRAPDAVWVAVLTLLALQSSFLLPPLGYAVMMARARMAESVPLAPLARALAPFLAAQIVVLALTIAYPALTHLAEPAVISQAPLSNDEATRRLEEIVPATPDDE